MIRVFKKLWGLFDDREKRSFIFIMCGMIFATILELVSIGALIPFLSVLADPDVIFQYAILNKMYAFLGLENASDFLLFLGILASIVLVILAVFKAAFNYQKYKFTNINRHNFALRLMKQYLAQPYSFFLTENSNTLSKNVLSEVDQLIDRALLPILQIISHGFLIIMIIVFLVFLNPMIPIILVSFLGTCYLLFYNTFKRKISRISDERYTANEKRFKAVNELFGGIKEFKAFGKDQDFLPKFTSASLIFSDNRTLYDTLSEVPKSIIETVGFLVILTVCFILLYQGADMKELIPTIGLFTFAAYKLLPAMQQIYFGVIQFRFGYASIQNTLNNLYAVPPSQPGPIPSNTKHSEKLFSSSLKFKAVSFIYPESDIPSLQDISFDIKSGERLAIVGQTGAGKSTLVDLILGLITPSSGKIVVDDTIITPLNSSKWQKQIGYVPQQTFLLDDTIARNIALDNCSEEEHIDADKIIEVAKKAQIHDFIMTLPDQYETSIGERGIRLSGGQRQRISIARALYREPDILLFDEATSSLDVKTEKEVLDAIDNLSTEKTIVMITHRPNTLSYFDKLLKIQDGQIVSFEQNK